MAAAASAGTTFGANAEWWMRPGPCMAHHPFRGVPGRCRAGRAARGSGPIPAIADRQPVAREPVGGGGRECRLQESDLLPSAPGAVEGILGAHAVPPTTTV